MKKIVIPGFLAGVVNLIVGMLLSQIYSFIFPSIALEYINPALFRPWSDPLMSLIFLYPFVLGFVLAWVWDKTKKLFEAKSEFERACKFGGAYWVIAGIPGMLITYSSFQVSLLMVLAWTISGFVEAVVAGFIFVKKNP
ncbi:hypothetical protein A2771_02510 [Candidatus Woesebacteria bacterium RIFCSPHIGHO2_01_FULL_38_26b]|uniref:DUF1761 domain-containing protein n=1 Tax=Candidatus Woesebacteria bacterium RIFCSPHIGHO2_01_FULL_38_26b TaxID=1802491 RepID=A0A1F7Y2B6_9BACT|nr:MAG: hypothetical protein A2771_02510 [Candidatus Woesebacteria bacterium RIFCSPHIGHO2_01_FULL_38_26b]